MPPALGSLTPSPTRCKTLPLGPLNVHLPVIELVSPRVLVTVDKSHLPLSLDDAVQGGMVSGGKCDIQFSELPVLYTADPAGQREVPQVSGGVSEDIREATDQEVKP